LNFNAIAVHFTRLPGEQVFLKPRFSHPSLSDAIYKARS
jgi:hypothetical protein